MGYSAAQLYYLCTQEVPAFIHHHRIKTTLNIVKIFTHQDSPIVLTLTCTSAWTTPLHLTCTSLNPLAPASHPGIEVPLPCMRSSPGKRTQDMRSRQFEVSAYGCPQSLSFSLFRTTRYVSFIVPRMNSQISFTVVRYFQSMVLQVCTVALTIVQFYDWIQWPSEGTTMKHTLP